MAQESYSGVLIVIVDREIERACSDGTPVQRLLWRNAPFLSIFKCAIGSGKRHSHESNFSQQSLRLDIGDSVHFHASDFLASKSPHTSFEICSMELQKRPSTGGSACTLRVKFYIYITGQIGAWPLPVVSSNN